MYNIYKSQSCHGDVCFNSSVPHLGPSYVYPWHDKVQLTETECKLLA